MKLHTISISKLVGILAFGLFSLTSVQAEEVKIGNVSLARIMRESAPVKAVDAKLKKEFSKREKALGAMSDHLKEKAAKLDKDFPVLAESDRVKRKQELEELHAELQNKVREYRQAQAQRRNEESAAFGKQLEKAIKKVAEAEKLDIIVQDALYSNPKFDVTEKVLEELN